MSPYEQGSISCPDHVYTWFDCKDRREKKILQEIIVGCLETQKNKSNTTIFVIQMIARGKGRWGEVEVGKGRVSGDGKRLDLGCWAHNAVCGDVLFSCTLATCMGLLTSVIPLNSNKKIKIRKTGKHNTTISCIQSFFKPKTRNFNCFIYGRITLHNGPISQVAGENYY